MSTLARALEIAHEAHAGQVDKAGRPYIDHVLRVVAAVESEDAKVVAALHDVLEDSPKWTGRRLYEAGIPKHLIDIVFDLTRPAEMPYEAYIKVYSHIGLFRTVKIADIRDNSDPARLALLPEADRARLSKRYAAALEQLGRAARLLLQRRGLPMPDPTNADLLRAAILAEMEWNFERTPERRKAADEAQARVLERMVAQTKRPGTA